MRNTAIVVAIFLCTIAIYSWGCLSSILLFITIPCIATLIVVLYLRVRPAIQVGIILIQILLVDVLNKTLGGSHDLEGADWQEAFESISVLISLVIFSIAFFRKFRQRVVEKIISLLLFIAILILYSNYFYSLNIAFKNDHSRSMKDAKSAHVFISELSYTDSLLVKDQDTFVLSQGWVEHETRTNHKSLFKKTEYTGRYNYVIKLKGNFNKGFENSGIFYKANQPDGNGSESIDSLISFVANKSFTPTKLFFFYNHVNVGLRPLKEIEIKPK